jgi:hypothetical protein
MTQIADAHGQRLEAAARSVNTKFRAFDEGLAPDEREVLGLALRQIAAGTIESAGDATGHMLSGSSPALPGLAELRGLLGSVLGIGSPGPRVLTETPPASPPFPPIPVQGPRTLA